MRKIWTAAAVLVVMAACDSATAAEQNRGGVREAPATPLAVASTTVEEMSIVSVRRVVPGLYTASAINTAGGNTRIIVRRNAPSLGFQSLTSGTLVHNEVRSTGEEMPFMVSAGYRYLVIAAPTTAEGEDDMVRATYVEFTT